MALDLYSKGTTDTLLAAKLDLAGGTMTGALNLSASGIIFSDSTYLTTAPAGSTLAADQLTAGVVTANPTTGPTASGDVLQYDGTNLIWAPSGGGGTVASNQITAGVVTANPTTGPSTDWSSLYYAAGDLYWSTSVAAVQITNGYASSVAANPVAGQFLKFNSVSQIEWADLPTPPPTVKTVNNVDVSSSDYVLALTDANNIVNVATGDGSSSGYVVKIPAESSVNFAVGTEVLFTCSQSSGSSYNYINGDSGVTVIQSSNNLNAGFMRQAVKLGSDLWMISSQI